MATARKEAGAELLVITPASSLAAVARLLPNATVTTESGHSFAADIESAFSLAFERGAKAALLVVGDTPPLARSDLQQAFAHLESSSRAMVLVPSSNGGTNAVGFNACTDRPIHNISSTSADASVQLVAAARGSSLALLLMPAGHDLDSAGDVAALYRISRAEPSWRAFRWLLQSLLLACRPAVVVVGDAIGELPEART